MCSVWGELQRRNVVRVAIAYVIVAWLLIQVAATTFPVLQLPEWTVTLVTVLLVIGFPVALVFAWAFELTPQGLKKEKDVDRAESITHITGRKLDFVIISVLAIAVVFLVVDKFYLDERDAIPDETSATRRESIAVLPFVNMSDDPDNEYFSDGISEEILNLLANVPELQVTSRSSAFSFKGQNVDVPTMAAKLNVAHVLEGSVRKSGDQLRITAQLIKVANDSHLWSQTYDRELRNIFAIQDEIAAAVVDALQITLLGKELKATETSPEAYALYLEGQHLARQGSAEGVIHAETLLKEALAIDPGFAPAWVWLGFVYTYQAGTFGFRLAEEGYELARDAAGRALAADPEYGIAYALLASIERNYDRDFTAAAQHLKQALALNPGDAGIVSSAAGLELTFGRVDEAIDIYRQALVLDPLSGHYSLGRALHMAHRYEEAADALRKSISLKPDLVGSRYRLGLVLLSQGDPVAALQEVEKERLDGYRLTGMAMVQHTLGDAAASDAALDELIERFSAEGAFQVAEVFAYRGDIDNAFAWLDRAYENRDPGLASILLDPMLANLRDVPRWNALLDKLGLPH